MVEFVSLVDIVLINASCSSIFFVASLWAAMRCAAQRVVPSNAVKMHASVVHMARAAGQSSQATTIPVARRRYGKCWEWLVVVVGKKEWFSVSLYLDLCCRKDV